MHWITLSQAGEWDALLRASSDKPVFLFKHSPRCGTSAYVKDVLSHHPMLADVSCYLLDVIQARPLARKIAEDISERHESPQILLLHHGDCVWAEDHMAISPEEIREELDRRLTHG